MQIDKILSAESQPLLDVLSPRGRALHIPLYQREYSWDPKDIVRLIEDLMNGIDQVLEDANTLIFVGSILASAPSDDEELGPARPKGTLTLIDGQQRMTTFVLLGIVLHDALRMQLKRLDPEGARTEPWITEAAGLLQKLTDFIVERNPRGVGPFQYTPRLIRSMDDLWGTNQHKARYRSPVAHLVHSYITVLDDGDAGSHFVAREIGDDKLGHDAKSTLEDHTRMVGTYNNIRKLVRSIIREDRQTDFPFPGLQHLSASSTWSDALLDGDYTGGSRDQLLGEAQTDDNVLRLLRTIILTQFTLERVALTFIESNREDYALDMFDSLNTTGQPLTAIETFKPRVVNSFDGIGGFNNSVASTHFDIVERALDSSDNKQKITRQLVTMFALAESGRKLSRSLSDQRRWLRKHYSSLSLTSQHTAMTECMAHSAEFAMFVWRDERIPSFRGTKAAVELPDTAKLALAVLRDTGHEISQAPLTTYYSHWIRSDVDKPVTWLEDVLKAVLAFWSLWRSSSSSTAGIDQRYRQLMAHGLDMVGLEPLARTARRDGNDSDPRVDRLRAAFRRLLDEKGVGSREGYVEQGVRADIYSASRLAKFIILATEDGCVADPRRPGLTIKSDKSHGGLRLLQRQRWDDEDFGTVEHVAPQRRETGADWPKGLWADQLIDTIGNLTLLPMAENSVASNRSWSQKRVLYSAYAAESRDEVREKLRENPNHGISEAVQERLIDLPRSTPSVKALATRVEPWDEAFVIERGRHVLGQFWDRVSPWLDY